MNRFLFTGQPKWPGCVSKGCRALGGDREDGSEQKGIWGFKQEEQCSSQGQRIWLAPCGRRLAPRTFVEGQSDGRKPWTHFYLSARLVAGGSSSTAVPDGQDNEGGASTTLYTTPGAAAIPCLPPLSLLASAAEALLQSDAMAIDPAPSSSNGGSTLLQPPPLAGSTQKKKTKPETLKP